MKDRVRATFMTDRQLWKETQQLLADKGYPPGAMSYYLTTCVESLNSQLEEGNEKQLHLFTLQQLADSQ